MDGWILFGIGVVVGIGFTVVMFNIVSSIMRPRKYYLQDDDD